MADRVSVSAGEALAAGDVVGDHRVLRVCFDDTTCLIRELVVLACRVQRLQRGPHVPAVRCVRASDLPAESEECRPRLFGEGRALHVRRAEDERPCRRVLPLAVELEDGSAAQHEVQLLVSVLFLVVLVDDPVARGMTGPRVDAERLDTEVVPHRTPSCAAVTDLLELIELHRRVRHHASPTSAVNAGSSRTRSKSESSRAKSLNPGKASIARPRLAVTVSASAPAMLSKHARL